ncbi:MAG: hypothetical protein ACREQ3_18865, partial [Candidatus Binatia bacterium]
MNPQPLPFSTIFCVPEIQPLLSRLYSGPEQGAQTRVLKQDRGTTVTLLSLPTGAVVLKRQRLDT